MKARILILGSALILGASAVRAEVADFGPGGPPFPNDAGPGQVDVSKYPPEMQAAYKVFARRCSQCHTLARPINSQYLQLAAEEQKVARVREPVIFTDSKIWHIGDGIWNDYFGRMYMKPGAGIRIRPSEVDQVVTFLVYDSKVRKSGAHEARWKAQRQALLDAFRTTNPKRYDELFGK